jgi:hypothetical protein
VRDAADVPKLQHDTGLLTGLPVPRSFFRQPPQGSLLSRVSRGRRPANESWR